MTPLEIGTTILEAIQKLFGLRAELNKAKAERRTQIAAFLGKVAECLESVAGELQAGNYPHRRCSELLHYATMVPAQLGAELGASADEIAVALQAAHRVEMLHAARTTPDGQASIAKIEEAAGLLRAVQNMIVL